jgi:hypothetical protein
MRHALPAALAALSLILAGGCVRSPRTAGDPTTVTTAGKTKPACPRKTVKATALIAELTYVQNCGGIGLCVGGDRNPETKEIAGSTGGWNWLWTGASGTNIDEASQNILIADAHARAQAARPANKVLRKINYNGGVVVDTATSSSSVIVGATATYVECGAEPGDRK